MKAQRWREMISTDDDTLTGRRTASPSDDTDADVAAASTDEPQQA